jgi:hypothetical protein
MDSARMLDQLGSVAALRAEILPAVRVLLVGRYLADPVVLDADLDAARGQAISAEGEYCPHAVTNVRCLGIATGIHLLVLSHRHSVTLVHLFV